MAPQHMAERRSRMFHGCRTIVLVAAVSLSACVTGTAPLYQDSSLVIRLESNPAGKTASQEVDPRAFSEEQITAVLRGLSVRKKEGLFQYVVGGRQAEPVFPEEQIAILKTELLKALRQAGPDERVAFQLWTTSPKGIRDETTGAMYLRGRLLHVVVSKFRQSARVSYEGAEGGSGKDFELLFEPADAVIDAQGFATRWLGSYRPEVVINLQRLAPEADLAKPPPSTVLTEPRTPSPTEASVARPSDERTPAPRRTQDDRLTLEQLQRQIDELTRANQQLKNASTATQEEVSQLRQELAETKQALADKVLELNRLKSKSKPKAATPAPR
jgi:hypothetical protein